MFYDLRIKMGASSIHRNIEKKAETRCLQGRALSFLGRKEKGKISTIGCYISSALSKKSWLSLPSPEKRGKEGEE